MHQKMSDFILTIHDASMYLPSAEFHRWTLREFRQHIDFDFAIWGAGNGQSRQLHMATILDQVDTFFDTWEAVKHDDDYADLVIGNTGKTWSIEQLPRFRHSRAYSEHWGRYHAKQMISTMELDPRTGLHIFVTLARENRNQHFISRDVRIKNLVTQHLFLAARHNEMHCLRSHQAPAAFIDPRGLVHAALPDFSALLIEAWGRQAAQLLPEKVNTALWLTGHYRDGRLSLNAERLHNRLLVRAGISPPVSLSDREEEIGWMYAAGNSHKQVAKTLNISPSTVRTHLARIYQKLNLSDKGSLAIWLKENY